jgi:hypothetical protein
VRRWREEGGKDLGGNLLGKKKHAMLFNNGERVDVVWCHVS